MIVIVGQNMRRTMRREGIKAQLLSELIGKRVKSYKEGRICKGCGKPMSIYNPNRKCFECTRKAILKKRDKVR